MKHVAQYSEVHAIRNRIAVFVVPGGFDVYEPGDPLPVVPSDPYFPVLEALQIRLALEAAGLLTAVDDAVVAAGSVVQIWWRDSKTFTRHHPLLLQMIAALGWTDEQVDALWHQAAAL